MTASRNSYTLVVLVIAVFSFCLLIDFFEVLGTSGTLSSLQTIATKIEPFKTIVLSSLQTPQQSPPNCSSTRPDSYELQPLFDTDPEFLKTYVKWHAEKRKCLADPSCKEKPKVLLSRCPKGGKCLGIGDRIRGVYFSFWLAIATERVLLIEWTKDPYWLRIGMIPASIDWTIPSTIPYNNSWPFLDWNKHCTAFQECKLGYPRENRTFSYDGTIINFLTDDVGEKLGDAQLISIYTRIGVDRMNWLAKNPLYADKFGKYVETMDITIENATPVMRSLFRPSPQTLMKMAPIAFKEYEPYYAMHLRTGEAVHESSDKRFKSFATKGHIISQNMVNCLELIRNTTDGPKRVFIAADSDILKEYATQLFHEKGYQVKFFQDKVVHLGNVDDSNNRELRNQEKKMCDTFLSVYADLFMLARSIQIVSSGSHFSAFASTLTDRVKITYLKTENEKDVAKKCFPKSL